MSAPINHLEETSMTRQRKTPAQRAQEAYDVACRVAERLDTKQAEARAEADKLHQEHAAAVQRRDYLAQHPDLPKAPPAEVQVAAASTTGEQIVKALNATARKAKTR